MQGGQFLSLKDKFVNWFSMYSKSIHVSCVYHSASFVPKPRSLQIPYCKRQEAGRGSGNKATVQPLDNNFITFVKIRNYTSTLGGMAKFSSLNMHS